jgi:GNAT superfamily N-acetyltransferase
MPMALRAAGAQDAPALAAFAGQAFHDTYRGLDDPREIAEYVAEHFNLSAVQALLRDAACHTLLAEVDGGLAGYAVIRRGEPPACVTGPAPIELSRLYLGAGFIGQGLGAALMKAVQAEARHLGGRTLWLGVYDRNVRAVRFYERFGFRPVGGKEFLFGGRVYIDPIYAVTMAP